MTYRAIWTPTGTPFPHHADFETEAEAMEFAAGNGVETAVVPLDGLPGGLGATEGLVADGRDQRDGEKR